MYELLEFEGTRPMHQKWEGPFDSVGIKTRIKLVEDGCTYIIRDTTTLQPIKLLNGELVYV